MICTIDLSDRRPLKRIWLIVAAWAVLATIEAIILVYQNNIRFGYAVVSAIANYSIMGLLVWLSCWLNVRLQLWRQPPLRALGVYLGVGLAGLTAWCIAELLAMRVIAGAAFWPKVFASSWMFQLLSAACTYAAAFG